MADVVQYRLEHMVDELDDLERRGLFTRREISDIVKQRRKFEYRLKRPCPLKQDYLAYIEYEIQLDSLRQLRKKAVTRELKKQGNKRMRKSVSDFAGVTRIIDIYRLAVTRYKGDIDLWFRYLEFCRERKNGRMKKVLAQLIRFHPKVPGVWIYAAAWEFDHNTNVNAARSLMLSGLRVCPTSEDLWVEYLRMELTYLNKLKARKVALGEDEGSLVSDNRVAEEKQWRDENKDLFMSFGEGEDNGGSIVETESNNQLDLFREQGSNILETIYNGAIEAIPSSFSLRKRVLEILEATDLAHSEEMHSKILQDIKRDFSTDPRYWDWLARLEYDPENTQEISDKIKSSQIENAVQVYEDAIKCVPSSAMFSLYVEFLMSIITRGDQNSGLSNQPKNLISHLLTVCETAEILGHITEDFGCQYVSLHLQLERLNEARKLAEKLCCGRLSNSVKLWVLRISTEMKCITKDSPSPSKDDLLSIFELTREVLRKFSVSESESLWLVVLKFFANQSYYFDKLVEISFIALAKYGDSEDGFSLSSAIVDFVLQKDGLKRTREVYKRFLGLPHPGLATYRTCIEMESNLASAGDKDGLANARKLYESALTTYDQNVSLWQEYYIMETKMGSSETATAVRWRARKTLKDATALVTYTDL